MRRNTRRAVLVAAALSGVVAVVDLLGLALHVRGVVQGVLSYAIRLSSIIELPGFILIDALGLRENHDTGPLAWSVMLALTFIVYVFALRALFVAPGLLRRLGHHMKRNIPAEPAPRPVPAPTASQAPIGATGTAVPRLSRRAILAGGAGVAAAGVLGYGLAYEPRRVRVTRQTLALRGLPASLHGLRVVQLTDLHHGPWISIHAVRSFVRRTNALDPDLVVLTGDYVHRSPVYIRPVVEALADLRAKIGVVAVLGNHDWWEDGPLTQRELTRIGVPLLDNARRFLTPDRRLVAQKVDAGLCLAGVGDYYEDQQRYGDALGDVPASVPRLLLSHNPDVAEDDAFLSFVRSDPQRHRVDLILAGHTHGGQVHLAGLRLKVSSRHGDKYAAGWVQGPVCPVYVSCGLGLSVLPMRVNVPPEITLLELASA